MAGHTPGPWEAVENGGRLATDVFAGDLQIADCDWPQGELDGVTLESNARLIAAAPDLYEFARDIRDNYDHEECYHRNGMAGMCCRVCKAEAILAKAEGTS